MTDFMRYWSIVCARNAGFADAMPDDTIKMTMKQLRSNLEKAYGKGWDDAMSEVAEQTDVLKPFGNIFGG